jgi:3-hydroxyisobutyrate dehydrogenase-like beta-hydroxyacid dehydrogenase
MKPRIGFAGLGLMGTAMCQRLLDQGYALAVLGNRDRTGVEACLARGATEAASGKALAQAADVVILCMGTSAQVESRMHGPDGILAGAARDLVVIDTGTSLPGSTRALAAAAQAQGVHYMDAPLGRTPSHGREGKLNIMAAGPEALFARVRPLLDDLGENVFHVGPVGAGHTLKLINNFFAMTTAMAMSEAFAMADLAGLPRQSLYDVMAAGPLRSGMMDFIKAHAIDDQIKLAFSLANAGKDVGYYGRMAEELDVPSLMSVATRQTLALAKARGWGDRMVPEAVDFFAELFRKETT